MSQHAHKKRRVVHCGRAEFPREARRGEVQQVPLTEPACGTALRHGPQENCLSRSQPAAQPCAGPEKKCLSPATFLFGDGDGGDGDGGDDDGGL